MKRARTAWILLILSTSCVARPTTEQELVRDAILAVRGGRFASVAAQFHVRPDGSAANDQRERRYLIEGLQILREEFGSFGAAEALSEEPVALSVGVLSADARYWRSHPDLTRYMYAVTFSRAGPGYLLIEVCNIAGRPELRQMAYGLPADGSASVTVVQTTSQRLRTLIDRLHSAEARARETS